MKTEHEEEIWKDIPGFEGEYQASNLGRIRGLDREVSYSLKGTTVKRLQKGKILTPHKNRDGYFYVSLDSRTLKALHYFIGITFLGPKPDGFEINHKDGNKSNNAVSNLEWVTPQQNVIHAFEHKLRHSGSKHGTSKLTESQVGEIKEALANKEKFKRPYYTEIAVKYGVDRTTIANIANNKNWAEVI